MLHTSHPSWGGCWCLFIQLRLSHKFRTFCGFYWNSISWLIHPNSDHSGGGCQRSPLGQWLRVSGCTQERKQVLQSLLRFRNGLWAYFQRPRTAKLGTWGGVMAHVWCSLGTPISQSLDSLSHCVSRCPEITCTSTLLWGYSSYVLYKLYWELAMVSPNTGLTLRVWWLLTISFTFAPCNTHQFPILSEFLSLSSCVLTSVVCSVNGAQAQNLVWSWQQCCEWGMNHDSSFRRGKWDLKSLNKSLALTL